MTMLSLVLAVAASFQDREDYNKKLTVLIERIEQIVDDAAGDLVKEGKINEAKSRMANVLFNQLTYAFKITVEEYMTGKRREFTDEMNRAQELLQNIAKSKDVEGGWLVKAAHQKVVPKIRRALAQTRLSAPWSACDGSEKDCATCQVIRKGK